MMAALTVALPLIGAAAKKSSGSPVLLIIVAIGAGFYFLIYRPQQRKAKALREQSNSFDVGDEVLTAGGIVGYVVDIDDDRVTLETSVGASFVVLKQYVIRKLDEPVPSEPDADATYEDEESGDVVDGEEEPTHPTGATEDGTDSGHNRDPDPAEDASAGDHPAAEEGSTGTSTKAESGDDDGGSDGPPII